MSDNVRVSNSAFYKMIAGKIISGFFVALVIAALVYLSLAAVLIQVIPSRNMGPIMVTGERSEGGLIPEGAIVLIGEKDMSTTPILGNLQKAFTPQDVAIVKVLAGPSGDIRWTEGGVTTVKGVLIDGLLEEDPKSSFLKGRYIVKCIEGCEPGKAMLIDENRILGVPMIEKYHVESGVHESLQQSTDTQQSKE